MKILRYDKIKRKKDMFKVFFDNDETIILTADTIVKFGIKPELELNGKQFEELLSFDRSKKVMADALALVSKRSYSSKSLQEKLVLKGYDPENAKKAAERMKELNYINDERYAKVLAEYLAGRGKGEFAIKAELDKHGIKKEYIIAAMEYVKSETEPHEQIIKILKSKFKKFDPKDSGEVRRAAAFFIRRGFSSESVAKALRHYKGASLEEDE